MSKKNHKVKTETVSEDLENKSEINTEVIQYKNIANCPVNICGHKIHPNGIYEIQGHDLEQEINIKRLERAVELNLIEKI